MLTTNASPALCSAWCSEQSHVCASTTEVLCHLPCLFLICRRGASLQSYADRHAPALNPTDDALSGSERSVATMPVQDNLIAMMHDDSVQC